jgi:hypothetical protein
MTVGVSVRCTVCGRTKKPHGRSAPLGLSWCTDECEGYEFYPQPGCLWPGESGEEFGYEYCMNAQTHAAHPFRPSSSCANASQSWPSANAESMNAQVQRASTATR